MTKPKKQELSIFLIIVGIASFFRLYQLNISFEILPVSLLGILTIIGLYLLTRTLFEWRVAAITSYLGAISLWHVDFSRTESLEVIVPFILVYAFYFIWRGLKHSRMADFVMAGLFGGLACLPAGRDFLPVSLLFLATLIVLMLFVNYWWYLKKDFSHSKYESAKTKLLQCFVVLFLTTFIVALPFGIYSWQHAEEIFSPMKISLQNVIQTLAIFNFTNSPLLAWPIGVFFVVGFINELIHWLRRKHGHFSTTHTLLIVWFFMMLIPGFMSAEGPNTLLVIGSMPVVMIITGRGIWWFFDKLNSWYKIHDPHTKHEAHAITALVLMVFLFSIGFMEYWRYFK